MTLIAYPRRPGLAAASLALCMAACGLPRKGLEEEIGASLRERIGAARAGIAVDSVRLGGRQASAYTGRVYLSEGGIRESDSIVVKSGLEGLSYEFPESGPLLGRAFR